MLKSGIQRWFESHPAISIRKFGIECGYPDGGYFQRWIKMPAAKGETVAPRIQKKIKPVLKRYGYAAICIYANKS